MPKKKSYLTSTKLDKKHQHTCLKCGHTCLKCGHACPWAKCMGKAHGQSLWAKAHVMGEPLTKHTHTHTHTFLNI